ncbi:transmembrane protein 220-like [Corticium candelabrum]|uniref:transmembrane protein 220-like n=1 Tax=Corticium candelabrum TaxID=121492 RepID=UPI002E262063|nr:transmembrane protein 220-like [Corticium candelabrum]
MEISGGVLWRVINSVAALYFAIAAYVQMNDPDPILWIPLYAVPSLLCFSVVVTPTCTASFMWSSLSLGHVIVCSTGALYIGSIGFLKGTLNPLKAEEGREFTGLLIVVLWLSLCTAKSKANLPAFTVSAVNFFVAVLAILPVCTWLYWHFREQYNWELPEHCKGSFGDLLGKDTFDTTEHVRVK